MPDEPRITLQPMVHVDDMHTAVAFYERLGARVVAGNSDGDFVLLDVGGSQLTLLAHPPNPEQGEGRVELNFLATAPLEELELHLTEAGVTIDTPTTDQGFGKQLVVRSPDGLPVKINQIDQISYQDHTAVDTSLVVERSDARRGHPDRWVPSQAQVSVP